MAEVSVFHKWQAFGSGVGIEIRRADLCATVVRVRPSGVEVLGALTISSFRERPAAEWGAEYLSFVKSHGAAHLAATVVLPRRDVIVRLLMLPGVSSGELDAAVGFQADALHPWGDDEVAAGWTKVNDAGAVLAGVARRAVVTDLAGLLAEAGIAVAAFTFSASAIRAASRVLRAPDDAVLAIGFTDTGEVEAYGESIGRPVFSAVFDQPVLKATQMAAAELRLDPNTEAARISDLLATPKAKADFEVARFTLPYAAALTAAASRLAPVANLLPVELRASNSRAIFIPTAALAAMLALTAGAWWGYSAWSDRQYLQKLEAEMARLEPDAKRASAAERTAQTLSARAALLDEFRQRSKSDLDILNEVTNLLEPPAWATQMQIQRDVVTVAGEAESAAPLLAKFDASPYFAKSAFVLSIVRGPSGEFFRIRSERENGPVPATYRASAAGSGPLLAPEPKMVPAAPGAAVAPPAAQPQYRGGPVIPGIGR